MDWKEIISVYNKRMFLCNAFFLFFFFFLIMIQFQFIFCIYIKKMKKREDLFHAESFVSIQFHNWTKKKDTKNDS